MLKRLAILGLVILACGAWSQVPRDGSKQQENSQEQQKTAEPSKPVVVVDSQHGADNQEQAPEKPDKYPWGELLAPANIPNWFLVIVGGVTGWFVYKTLKAIKKQANIMEKQATDAQESGAKATEIALATAQAAQTSADAAAAQIQMMKDKERGRLRIEFGQVDLVGDPDPNNGYEVPYTLILDGATQVYITSASCATAIRDTEEIPAGDPWWRGIVIPDTMTPEQRTAKGSMTILTQESPWAEPFMDDPDPKRVALVREDQLHIFVRARIAYEDIFGGKWEVRVNRKLQYYWNPLTNAIDLSFGCWNSVGDNGEYQSEYEQLPNPN